MQEAWRLLPPLLHPARAVLLCAAVSVNLTLLGLLPVGSGSLLEDSWSDCSNDATPATVTGVMVDPSPALAGSEAVFTINATVGEVIAGGTLLVVVRYLGFKVFSFQGGLCQAAPCPLGPGPVTLSLPRALPGKAPPGYYSMDFTATTPATPMAPAFTPAAGVRDGGVLLPLPVWRHRMTRQAGWVQCGQPVAPKVVVGLGMEPQAHARHGVRHGVLGLRRARGARIGKVSHGSPPAPEAPGLLATNT